MLHMGGNACLNELYIIINIKHLDQSLHHHQLLHLRISVVKSQRHVKYPSRIYNWEKNVC